MIEELLQLFVCKVDTQLFETIELYLVWIVLGIHIGLGGSKHSKDSKGQQEGHYMAF